MLSDASSSCPAVTVTDCGTFQFDGVNVRLRVLSVRSVPAVVLTDTSTVPGGLLFNTTVQVPSPPSLIVNAGGLTVSPDSSSSRMVTPSAYGYQTSPDSSIPTTLTVPVTTRCLSGPSTSSSTALMVTAPVLVFCPAGIVNCVPVWVKSSGCAVPTGAADIVTSTSWATFVLSLAVTVL